MKKARKLWVAAVVMITAVLMIGCGNALTGVTVDSNDVDRNAGKVMMTGYISNYADFAGEVDEGDANARTILPPVGDGKYDYYLFGKTITGVELAMTQLKDDSAVANGKFKLPVASAAWEFTLIVMKENETAPTIDNYTQKALFVGHAFADLTNSNDDVTFTVSPDGLINPGIVKLTLTLSNDKGTTLWTLPANYTVKAEIQNMITGEVIKAGQDLTGGDIAATVTFTNSTGKFGTDAGFEIRPGTYNLVVKFTQTDGNKLESVWSDVIVVVPTREITEEVFIPNIIGTRPGNVSTLNAYYVNGSEDLTDGGRDGFYKVHFQWDAADVNNERYFELQIIDVSDRTTTDIFNNSDPCGTAKPDYNGLITGINNAQHVKVYSYDIVDSYIKFHDSDERVDGSLVANNTQLTMYLPLGAAYYARIRAVNNVGVSTNWTYVTIPATVDSAANAAYSDGDLKAFATGTTPTAATTINRFRITYKLNGGKYGTSPEVKKDKVEYYIKNAMTTASINPVTLWAANATDVNLKNGGAKFAAWTRDIPSVQAKTLADNSSYYVYKAVKGTSSSGVASLAATSDFKATTDDAVVDMAAHFTNTDVTVENLMADDDGGYIGIKNLVLYADYSGDLQGIVKIRDPAVDYKLYAKWITYSSSKVETAVPITTLEDVSNVYFTVSKAAATDTATSKCELTFNVTVPVTLYATKTFAEASPADVKEAATGTYVAGTTYYTDAECTVTATAADLVAKITDMSQFWIGLASSLTQVTAGTAYASGTEYYASVDASTALDAAAILAAVTPSKLPVTAFYVKRAGTKPAYVVDPNNDYYILTAKSDKGYGSLASEFEGAVGTAVLITKDVYLAASTNNQDLYEAAYISRGALEQYDQVTLTITDPYGNEKFTTTTLAGKAATPIKLGAKIPLAAVDVLTWENMTYNLKFTATKKSNGKTITRTSEVAMDLKD